MSRILQMSCCLIALMSFKAFSVALDQVVVKNESGKTVVFCTLAGVAKHKEFQLGNPSRVVVDFDKVSTSINGNSVRLGQGAIKRLRIGHPNRDGVRLVFDLKSSVAVNILPWKPKYPGKYGIQINLIQRQKNAPEVKRQYTKRPLKQTKPVAIAHLPKNSLRDVVVVIDPGHGGKDPGAIGPRHFAEKNVVLAIAQKLKQQIDQQPGMHAVLTRSGDYYVGLRERLNIARHYNADIFVSIHADAFNNHNSNGASIFALSQTGATSEAARWLAEKENYSELGGVNLSSLDDKNGVIRTVLLDLSQTATISASLKMGTQMLHHIDKITNLHNRAVEQARFVVLKSPDIPSVLVETGFITNPHDEKNLTSPYYQMQLTRAIFAGIKRYFLEYPPHGTRLEMMALGNQHVVKKGDSLPGIAKRYQITVAALLARNHLSSQSIKQGQRLSIPASWT